MRAACSSSPHFLLYLITFQFSAYERLSLNAAWVWLLLHFLRIACTVFVFFVHIVLLHRGTLWHFKGLLLCFSGVHV